MQVLVLGPVTVVDREGSHEVSAPRHRALVAALALRDGDPVRSAELIDAVWGDDPPSSADKTLQGYVSALRKQFGDDLIETVPGGYRLGDGVDSVDASDFAESAATGRRLLDAGDVDGAWRHLARALSLWRGEPATDFGPGPVGDGHRVRLAEIHLAAVEGQTEAELALGHHREIVPDLEQLVVEHPYRESLWRTLMLAHYRAGSAGAALGAARRLRAVLRDELGIDPGTETDLLEQRILDQDPGLDLDERQRGNLVAPLDSFVGRSDEQRRIDAVLRERRLVTLTGVGGVGKSRLARELGRSVRDRYPGGVWWVDVATLPGESSLVGHVLSTLDLSVGGASEPEALLFGRLRRLPTLLVLDNCEHERERVAAFAERLTSRVDDVRVLATSRVPLGVHGELVVTIGPLSVDGEDSESGRLFLDRASARGDVGPIDPAAVASIVEAVGGLPLGVELAAARCGALSASEVARQIADRRLLLGLSADDDDRHRTLGHVLGSTIDDLEPEHATILPRLAVLPGDFDVSAAAAVLDLPAAAARDAMESFFDASIVVGSNGPFGTRRFRLLWPIRELLLDRLDRTEIDQARGRFAEHFRAFAGSFVDDAEGPAEVDWLVRARAEDHNLRFALAWWEERDPLAALDFGPGLGQAWMIRGDQAEGRDVLQRLLAGAPNAESRLVAATELALSFLLVLSGDAAAAFAVGSDAIDRLERIDEPRWLARALRIEAHALHIGGLGPEVTDPIYERSLALARAAGLTYSRAVTEVHYAQALSAHERFEEAERLLPHAEAVLRRHEDHGQLAHAQIGWAFVAFGRGDGTACRGAADEMIREARLAADTVWEQIGYVTLGVAWHDLGEDRRSRRALRDAVRLAYDTANTTQLGIALHALAATVAGAAPQTAARLWGAAGSFSPIWPLHARRYGEWMAPARDLLGPQFDELVAAGAALSVDDAVHVAESLFSDATGTRPGRD